MILYESINKILFYFSVYSESGRNPQSKYGSVETSSHRLGQMMNSNKRWLEKRKKDTNMYPLNKLKHFSLLGIVIIFNSASQTTLYSLSNSPDWEQQSSAGPGW